MYCFAPASNQSAILTDKRHLFSARGVWKETNEELAVALVWSLKESAHCLSLRSTLAAPNTPISNEAVQYYITELDDCHHRSSEMNIFLVLLEDGNSINWKQVEGILLNACQCCPIYNVPIQNSDPVQFVDRNLQQRQLKRWRLLFMQINNIEFSGRQYSISLCFVTAEFALMQWQMYEPRSKC